MSMMICETAPVSETAMMPQDTVAEACREVRCGWSSEERLRRKKIAEVKQLGLLLNTVDFGTVLMAIVNR